MFSINSERFSACVCALSRVCLFVHCSCCAALLPFCALSCWTNAVVYYVSSCVLACQPVRSSVRPSLCFWCINRIASACLSCINQSADIKENHSENVFVDYVIVRRLSVCVCLSDLPSCLSISFLVDCSHCVCMFVMHLAVVWLRERRYCKMCVYCLQDVSMSVDLFSPLRLHHCRALAVG